MAQLDWTQCMAVERGPDGKYFFKNTRLPVNLVFENLAAGMPPLEIARIFYVQPEAVAAVLHFVSESMDRDPVALKQTLPKPPIVQSFSFLVLGRISLHRTSKERAARSRSD